MSPQEKLARKVNAASPQRKHVGCGQLYVQPDALPDRKVEQGALAAALTSVALGALTLDVELLAAGLGTTAAFAITAYLTRSRRRG